ncbi:MAG: helix-turn-helix domain-containing protein, partial [Negativicutes bacterium]|nr:helix-turn-helix domain-containing protein [Negativicutes bacterium]
PPLRKRKEDIVLLANEFLEKANCKYGFRKFLEQEALQKLVSHDWPGNVRELENFIERITVMCSDECIDITCINQFLPGILVREKDILLKSVLEDEEKKIIIDAYNKTGTTRKAAQILGISQSAFVKKLQKYQINVSRKKDQYIT